MNIDRRINMYKSKYLSKKTILNGIKFDSIKESNRYSVLKTLEKSGRIKDLQLQKKFRLQDGFKKGNKTYRPIDYICDFYYFDTKENKYIVEDVKSKFTEKDKVFNIKRKLFEYKYKDLKISIIK